MSRKAVVSHLETMGIQTRMLFAGNLIRHPCFDQMRAERFGYRVSGSLLNTEKVMQDTFWVGVYPGMTDEMVDKMAEAIVEAVKASM